MSDTLEEAKDEARADGFGDGIVKLADRLGGSAKASTVFGDPVERDGVTVIPVARVRWGVGGGSGRGRGRGRGKSEEAEQNEGTGGGGGVQASPLGFIELRGGQARYRRVNDPLRLAVAALILPVSLTAGAVVTIVTLGVVARSMRGMIHAPHWRRPE